MEKELNLSERLKECSRCDEYPQVTEHIKEFIKIQTDKPINPDCQCCVANKESLIDDAGKDLIEEKD